MELIENHEVAETLDDIETWVEANEHPIGRFQTDVVASKNLIDFLNEIRARNGIDKNV